MKFLNDDTASVKDVTVALGTLVTLIIAVLLFYNIAGAIDAQTIDDNLGFGVNATPTNNATNDTLDQAGNFFSIAPIIVIVIVAVVILRYVGMI